MFSMSPNCEPIPRPADDLYAPCPFKPSGAAGLTATASTRALGLRSAKAIEFTFTVPIEGANGGNPAALPASSQHGA
jgi:hypothetical protein